MNENIKLINPSSIIPLYKQVSHILTNELQNGVLKVGDKIPSELVLMDIYGVSRITIRAAIAELVDDGLLVRSQGKGTFVAPKKSSGFANDITGLAEACQRAGRKSHTKLLSIEYSYPTNSESKFLQINENEKVIETKRLRFIDSNPTIIETNHYIKEFDFLFRENLEDSLFGIFTKHNIHVTNTSRTLEICYASSAEASILDAKLNTPLLLFKDNQCDNNDRPIFISKQIYNTQNLIFYL